MPLSSDSISRELLSVVFQRLREREHDALAAARRHRRPGAVSEGRTGRGKSSRDVRGPRMRDVRDLAAGRGVERGEGPPIGGLRTLGADQQALGCCEEGAGGVAEGLRECGDGGVCGHG